MGNEKRDLGSVSLKFGVALALSLGGILYTFLVNKRTKSPRKHLDCKNKVNSGRDTRSDRQASPTTPHSFHFDPLATDKHDESHHLNDSDVSPNTFNSDKDPELPPSESDSLKQHSRVENAHEQEIKSLKNSIKILKERERNMEIQLLEYYGLKEQETAVMELQNRLKLNNMESKLFTLKIESLQAENRRLETQMNDYTKVVSDLEAARAKVKAMKKKLKSEAEQSKKQILDLQKRVEKMQEDEHKGVVNDPEIESRLHKLTHLEEEVEELRKSNHSLQLEKSDLARRFDCVQMLATSVLEDEETEKLKEETQNLKKQNEELSKEVERIQADRCADAEELVYLKWINACLRYELRNYQPGPGKTIARDLSKTLSPRSEEKAKQLIMEYANKEGAAEIDSDQWSCSQASVTTDSGEFDESFIDNSPPRKRKKKFFGKIMRVFRGKDSDSHHRNHNRNSSIGRSESGGEDVNSYSDSSVGQRVRKSSGGSSKNSVNSQRPNRRHSDIGLYKHVDSIAGSGAGGGGGTGGGCGGGGACGGGRPSSASSLDSQKSELGKYAEALKDNREKSKFMFPRRPPRVGSF